MILKERIFYLIIFIIVLTNIDFNGFRSTVIDGDGKGYYAYLPAVFIHNSLDFSVIYEYEKERFSKDYQGHYFVEKDGIRINKYYAGVAILLIPFFLIACVLSWIFGFPVDGYSVLFQYSVMAGALFYAAIGLYFAYQVLRLYKISHRNSLLSVAFFLFGTNLFFYTFHAPSFSHVYSFSAITAFFYYLKRYYLDDDYRSLVWAVVILGVVILIRPTNAIVVFATFFIAGDFNILFKPVTQHLRRIPLFLLLLLSIIGIQGLIYYLQTGSPFVYSYTGEGFQFSDPQINAFLFSYKKGLFIYTPLLIIALLGFISLFRKSVFQGVSLLVLLFILVYFLSSWWNWFYGDSFGNRAFIDYYIFFIILLGYFLEYSTSTIKKTIIPIGFLLVAFYMIQNYQYVHKIIHPDAMNKEKYWYVFLQTAPEYENVLGGQGEPFFKELKEEKLAEYQNSFEEILENWTVIQRHDMGDSAYSGQYVASFNIGREFNAGFNIQPDSGFLNYHKLFLKADFMLYELEEFASVRAVLVIEIEDKHGMQYFYKVVKLTDVPDEQFAYWKPFNTQIEIPIPAGNEDMVRVFIWNKDRKAFYIDDMSISFIGLH